MIRYNGLLNKLLLTGPNKVLFFTYLSPVKHLLSKTNEPFKRSCCVYKELYCNMVDEVLEKCPPPRSSLNPIQKWLSKRAIPVYFHCHHCDDEFSNKAEFDEHVVVHQIADMCYQIQECEDMRFEQEEGSLSRSTTSDSAPSDEYMDKENSFPPGSHGSITSNSPQPIQADPQPSPSPQSSSRSSRPYSPAPTSTLTTFLSDSDRICSLCFTSPSGGTVLDHLLDSHKGNVVSVRAFRKGKTKCTVAPCTFCEFCAELTFASKHDFFLHVWRSHIREGDELKYIKRPYKMILDILTDEGVVGVTKQYDAPLRSGAYTPVEVYQHC
uniref:C2H2-type domain-containing protein n=1 Tax=Steinernema glaseri TaxID=37863 RepID=A0A1I7YMY5_9BILA